MDNKTESSKPYSFTGSIPAHYDQYLGPLFFEPYAEEIAERIKGMRINTAVELASGTGRVTNHLRKALSQDARLIASDVSAEMLEIAKGKLKGEKIEWQIIDLNEIPFEDDSIDLIVCCFGYMFAADKVKAYAEAFRVLKKGGMLLIATWDRLSSIGASNVYRQVVKKYLPDPPPASFGLPFSMHDEEEIKNDIAEAGFSAVRIERVQKLSTSDTAKNAALGLSQGGTIYNEIVKMNPAWVNEITAEVEKQLTEKYGAAPMVAPMSALITQAWK